MAIRDEAKLFGHWRTLEISILIVGSNRDPHVSAVMGSLHKRGASPILLDAYSECAGGIAQHLTSNVVISIGGVKSDLSTIRSVWWRQKPKFEVPNKSPLDLYDYYFVQREWNTLFDFIASRLSGAKQINVRAKAKLAENKIFQLMLAEYFDLKIPRTIFSNNANDVASYFRDIGVDRCVYKTFSPYIPPNASIAYTTEIDIEGILDKEHQDTIDVAPGIFQELILPKYELRVNVVEDRVFSAKIEGSSDNNSIDWRASQFSNSYSRASLDKPLERELIAFHKELGLTFAAYDFIVNIEGDAYLLEANPSGQWMWLEQKIDLPISDAIADSLLV